MRWVVNDKLRPLYPRWIDALPSYRRLGGPQGRSERVRKTSPQPGIYPQTVQLLVSRYTDWAISALKQGNLMKQQRFDVQFVISTKGNSILDNEHWYELKTV